MAPPRSLLGSFWIAIAASLWATDALFRLPTSERIDPALLVACEHGLALLILWPLAWLRHRSRLTKLSASQWISVAFIGLGASAAATVLFTTSFAYINPSIAILLQKLQPVFVSLLAILFLGERPSRGFYGWATLALAAGVVLNFPDLRFGFLQEVDLLRSRGAIYALSAAALWAVATVVGKSLLLSLDFQVATFWRFFFGFAGLAAWNLLNGVEIPVATLSSIGVARSIAYMALFPGLLAMLFYYRGLQRTPASTVTIVELIFPVAAVALNTTVLGLPLAPMQLGAGAVLLAAVTRIALLR